MKLFNILLLVVTLNSCESFRLKKTSSEVLLNEELKTFNWDRVDTYPSFAVCDSLRTKDTKKTCFQAVLTEHIWTFLNNENMIVSEDVSDTLLLQFLLTKEADLQLTAIHMSANTQVHLPNIKPLLHQSLVSLPEAFPAIKRGQQVNTTFELPIIIQAK